MSVDRGENVKVTSSDGANSSGFQQQPSKENDTFSPINEQKQSCSSISPPASRPSHEGAHVRKGRLSTSDARKADHEVSSKIVSLSSATVMPRSTTPMPSYIASLLLVEAAELAISDTVHNEVRF